MSVDKYLGRTYHRTLYNCLHFTRDVWRDLTGVDISSRLAGVLGRPEDRRPTRSNFRSFTRLAKPVDPCLVLMSRPHVAPHAGVFVRGRVLHIVEAGVEYLPVELASRGFVTVRYYL